MNHLPRPVSYSFTRYLAAKRTVDDRALNQHVWRRLHEEVLAVAATRTEPITILESGGGIGTMIERLLEHGALPRAAYHMLDAVGENVSTAYERLASNPGAASAPPSAQWAGPAADYFINLASAQGTPLAVSLYTRDLFDFLASNSLEPVDLIIAHAFMDLVNVPSTLELMTRTLRPGALLYFTINFDGVTILQPTIDASFDALVEQVYHRTMDTRLSQGKPSGDSHTGRHFFHAMQKASIQVLDAGASDWVIIPHADGYMADEVYFLHFIVHTMQQALAGHPSLNRSRFAAWIEERHAQIERCELVYIAHQLDFLGRYDG